MNILEMPDELAEALGPGDPFDAVMSLDGEVFRDHKHRRTIKATIDGRDYFVKAHRAAGWREILKNILRLRWPTITAASEHHAIHRFATAGIPTVAEVAYGIRGTNPARLESFIMTETLTDMVHLDEMLEGADPRERDRLRRRAAIEIAVLSRRMHEEGMNHRDYYLCHFMLPVPVARSEPGLGVHVIDLHRAQIRRRTPARWMTKDLSGLLFSALDTNLTTTDCVRFLRTYFGSDWRDAIRTRRRFLRQIVARAVRVYRSEHGRSPQLPAGLRSF